MRASGEMAVLQTGLLNGSRLPQVLAMENGTSMEHVKLELPRQKVNACSDRFTEQGISRTVGFTNGEPSGRVHGHVPLNKDQAFYRTTSLS